MDNYTICNCKQVTYFDVEDALKNCAKFSDVEKTFEEVQKYLKKHMDIENITIYEQSEVFDRVDSVGEKFFNMNFKDCKDEYAVIEKYKKSIKELK